MHSTVSPHRDDILTELQQRLGWKFHNIQLLHEALTHPSVLGLSGGKRHLSPFGYERLEFLGDRVLALCVAEALLSRYPDEKEGSLNRRLTAVVRAETLADLAISIKVGTALEIAPGDVAGRDQPNILADAMEAIIAAVFVDGGLDAARKTILNLLGDRLDKAEAAAKDPKSALQEWSQGRGLPVPVYREIHRGGTAHNPVFHIGASVKGYPEITAEAGSKKIAERMAAAALLQKLLESQ